MVPAEAVSLLVSSLKRPSKPTGLVDLARILSATMDRLDDAEGDRIWDELNESLDGDRFVAIAPEFLPQLTPGKAHALASDLASTMCSDTVADPGALSRILTDNSRQKGA
jgi:hypothetical protein